MRAEGPILKYRKGGNNEISHYVDKKLDAPFRRPALATKEDLLSEARCLAGLGRRKLLPREERLLRRKLRMTSLRSLYHII